jgi:hypothetical protein
MKWTTEHMGRTFKVLAILPNTGPGAGAANAICEKVPVACVLKVADDCIYLADREDVGTRSQDSKP